MAYRKFDDAPLSADNKQMQMKTGGFFKEPWRRALQGIVNRVIGGTAGTSLVTAACGTGTTTGVKTATSVNASINGVSVAIAALDNINIGTGAYCGNNLELGKGTMGTNCVTKFLIFAGSDGVAQVTGPGNIVDKGGYASATLAAAACKLPELPENCVALGYMLMHGPEATGVNFSVGLAGTMGTCTFGDFIHMPYQE